MSRVFVLVGLLVVCLASAHATPFYSLDPASSSLATVDGAAYGLTLDDNINGFSHGADAIDTTVGSLRLYFSVDRVTVGVSGTDVNTEAQPGTESAAADVFYSDADSSNHVAAQETSLGLTTGFFGDDIDGLEYTGSGNGFDFFTVDFLSQVNGFGSVGYANDILLGLSGAFSVFAEGVGDIGLLGDDDIDAFALWDIVNPGQLDPGQDLMLFSLSSFSPSTATSGLGGFFSPADVFFTDFTGSFSVRYASALLGLNADDNIDGLDTAIVPEPSTLALCGMAAFSALVARRRAKARSRR